MEYLGFKDVTIYEKSKYTIIIRLLNIVNNNYIVEIEYLDKDSNYHLNLPLEEELKKLESEGKDISFWSKYRKWQKRKVYVKEEFDRIFEKLSKK